MAQYPPPTYVTSTTQANNPDATTHTVVVQPPLVPPLVVPTVTGHTVVVQQPPPRVPPPVASVVVQQTPGHPVVAGQTVTVQQPAVAVGHSVVMQQSSSSTSPTVTHRTVTVQQPPVTTGPTVVVQQKPGVLQPGVVQQTVVTPQPVVQQTTVYQRDSGNLLTGLGRATGAFVVGVGDALAGTQPTVVQTVVTQRQTVPQPVPAGTTRPTVEGVAKTAVSSPMDLLTPGHVVQLVSKVNGNCLRVLDNGAVDCRGETGPACEFQVLSAGPATIAIKLRNMAHPHCYLAINNGFFIGNGRGGLDCDFIPVMLADEFICFESAVTPNSHIGVLPSGDVTAPAQTTKKTDSSHFVVVNMGMAH